MNTPSNQIPASKIRVVGGKLRPDTAFFANCSLGIGSASNDNDYHFSFGIKIENKILGKVTYCWFDSLMVATPGKKKLALFKGSVTMKMSDLLAAFARKNDMGNYMFLELLQGLAVDLSTEKPKISFRLRGFSEKIANPVENVSHSREANG